jgi:K(+)-stimulated pyrophosphate-energized sodium pump
MIVPLMAPASVAKPAAAAPAPVVAVVAVPVAKVFFAVNSAEVPADLAQTLAAIVAHAKANPGARIAISGYHDPSGSQAANEEVAKNRAVAVRDALKNVGVDEQRIEMRKPVVTTGSGDPAEARRVEVSVQ